LINALLRSYLHDSLFDQAEKFMAKASFPEKAGNNQLARYLFYTGAHYVGQFWTNENVF
jgi:26S proteasome regulatory subunit N3